MNWNARSLRGELMDDPRLGAARFLGSLRGLQRVNRVTGSLGIVARPLEALARCSGTSPLRVLDVACGGGDLLRGLSRRLLKLGLSAELHGCDINPLAVGHAREMGAGAGLGFFLLDAVHAPLPEGYDVIMSSLFLHHLTDVQAGAFLRQAARAARRQVLVHDLVRSRRGHLLAHLGVRVLLCNDVCHHDGPRSVEAAFTIPEVTRLAQAAGLSGCRIRARFPARFLLEWQRP